MEELLDFSRLMSPFEMPVRTTESKHARRKNRVLINSHLVRWAFSLRCMEIAAKPLLRGQPGRGIGIERPLPRKRKRRRRRRGTRNSRLSKGTRLITLRPSPRETRPALKKAVRLQVSVSWTVKGLGHRPRRETVNSDVSMRTARRLATAVKYGLISRVLPLGDHRFVGRGFGLTFDREVIPHFPPKKYFLRFPESKRESLRRGMKDAWADRVTGKRVGTFMGSTLLRGSRIY
jgi:hypothetical protein